MDKTTSQPIQTASSDRRAEMSKGFLYDFAQFVRIISVPPLMVGMLIALLCVFRSPDSPIFLRAADIIVVSVGLCVFPILAYPLSALIPKIRQGGRSAQRSLAMVLSAAGYLGAWLYGLLSRVTPELLMILNGYIISVVLIIVSNKVLRFRASGHATSIAGPIGYISFFLGLAGLVPGLLAYLLIFWSSVYLKRHTVKEFLGGTLVFAVAFGLSCLIYFLA